MRVKRWIMLVILGTFFVGAGASIAFGVEVFSSLEMLVIRPLAQFFGALPTVAAAVVGGGLILGGGILITIGIRQVIRSLTSVLAPDDVDQLADVVFARRHLVKGPHIVVIGGGTGLSTMLRGLKNHTQNLTAVVTMADDGGSSGRIRSEFSMTPPGDVRNTLVALADTEPLMERLFQYRFKLGDGLKDHSFGNLFIAAMADITGDFQAAVRESSKVLAVRGNVFPSTLDEVVLKAEYVDGTVTTGESRIHRENKKIRRVTLEPEKPAPLEQVIHAIQEAHCIVLGPGSLYTSILPNLLIEEIADAVKRSSAEKIYVCNVMTQPGETDGYSVSDHLRALYTHTGDVLVNHVIANESIFTAATLEKYKEEGSTPVPVDMEAILELGVAPFVADLVPDDHGNNDLARHDPNKLAQAIMDILIGAGTRFSWEDRVIKQFVRVRSA